MPTCANCQSEQLVGTAFCSECGGNMIPTRKRDTTASLGQAPGWQTEAVVVPPPPEAQSATTHAVRITVLNSGRRLSLTPDQVILIGRQDANRGFYPDVDLSGDGGLEGGVSRRHARLTFQDSRCYVEDLESANGTFVNQQRLPPRTPRELSSGDELRLGTVVIRVDLP